MTNETSSKQLFVDIDDLTVLTKYHYAIGSIKRQKLNKLGLEYQVNGKKWHPLTVKEEQYICSASTDNPVLSGGFDHSVLYNGKKWLCVNFNTLKNKRFGFSPDESPVTKNKFFQKALVHAAHRVNGLIASSSLSSTSELSGEYGILAYNTLLLIPFEYAFSITEEQKKNEFFTSVTYNWVEHMREVIDDSLINYYGKSLSSSEVELTPWIVVDDYCACRCIKNTDTSLPKNRVAFIEKHPRVRVLPFDGEDENSCIESNQNWFCGTRGRGGSDGENPENELYGFYPGSREWCDQMLVKLGYKL